jgi:hypothetical protein
MTLQEFIEKLQALGRPELPVCLADWNESYMELWEGPAEAVEIVTGEYRNWPGGGNDAWRVCEDRQGLVVI